MDGKLPGNLLFSIILTLCKHLVLYIKEKKIVRNANKKHTQSSKEKTKARKQGYWEIINKGQNSKTKHNNDNNNNNKNNNN